VFPATDVCIPVSAGLKKYQRLLKWTALLAVGHPDVFDLDCMAEEPATFALVHVEPIDGAALVCEDLLEIADGEGLYDPAAGLICETPDGVDIGVFGQYLRQLRRTAGHTVHSATRQVAGFENLVEVSGD